MNTFLWIAVVALCLVLQGIVLHVIYRRKFAAHQAARMQFQQTMNGKLEQTKRQIGQLQNELKATRQHVKPLRTNDAPSAPSNSEARQALERELDDGTSLRSSLPLHGFADTQPSPQGAQIGSLLIR